MSIIEPRHSPRFYKSVVLGLVGLIIFVVGLTSFVAGQSNTQHQICQLIKYVGDGTQHGITTNSKIIRHDTQLGTKAAKADAAIRRESVSQATSLLIRIQKIHC